MRKVKTKLGFIIKFPQTTNLQALEMNFISSQYNFAVASAQKNITN